MTKELFTQAILTFMHIPYRWGGDDSVDGFDCSGGVQEILAMLGLDPKGDQTAQGLHDYFIKEGTPHVRGLGSLVFYGSSRITHIAIMIDENHVFEFGGGGSKTTTKEMAALHNAFGRIRPFNHRKDLKMIIKPKGMTFS